MEEEEEDEDELPLSSVGMLRRLSQEEPDFMPLINVWYFLIYDFTNEALDFLIDNFFKRIKILYTFKFSKQY